MEYLHTSNLFQVNRIRQNNPDHISGLNLIICLGRQIIYQNTSTIYGYLQSVAGNVGHPCCEKLIYSHLHLPIINYYAVMFKEFVLLQMLPVHCLLVLIQVSFTANLKNMCKKIFFLISLHNFSSNLAFLHFSANSVFRGVVKVLS